MLSKRVFFHVSSWDNEAENDQLFRLQYHSCVYGSDSLQNYFWTYDLFDDLIKPSRNFVINFAPLGLRQLKKEFALGRMNFRIFLCKD